MRLIVFSDIDDTLMQTERKSVGLPGLLPSAVNKKGDVGSYTADYQRGFFNVLKEAASVFVPVTARSRAGLARVDLGKPFTDGAVVDFGAGVLTAEGDFDESWSTKLREAMDVDSVSSVFESVRAIVDVHWPLASSRIEKSNDVPAYLLLRPENPERIEDLARYLADLLEASNPGEFYFHVTDRDVCVLPCCVNKGDAVSYLMEQHGWGNELVVGLGDSLSDMAFMSLAHFQVVPQRSRLSAALVNSARSRKEVP